MTMCISCQLSRRKVFNRVLYIMIFITKRPQTTLLSLYRVWSSTSHCSLSRSQSISPGQHPTAPASGDAMTDGWSETGGPTRSGRWQLIHISRLKLQERGKLFESRYLHLDKRPPPVERAIQAANHPVKWLERGVQVLQRSRPHT